MTAVDGQREQLAAAASRIAPGMTYDEVAHVLLPVVQRIADQRAAEELRAAAVLAGVGTPVGQRLLARADVLDDQR